MDTLYDFLRFFSKIKSAHLALNKKFLEHKKYLIVTKKIKFVSF